MDNIGGTLGNTQNVNVIFQVVYISIDLFTALDIRGRRCQLYR